MKKILSLLFMGLSLYYFSQETGRKSSRQSKNNDSINSNLYREKVLFQDRDLIIIRQTKPDGAEYIKLQFEDSSPIQISSQEELIVQNKIIAKNLQLSNLSYKPTMDPDHILDLKELEKYIKQNKRLPNFYSNKDMVNSGIDVGDFQTKLLKKIEELSLIVIDQNKRIENMERDIKKMKVIIVNQSSR